MKIVKKNITKIHIYILYIFIFIASCTKVNNNMNKSAKKEKLQLSFTKDYKIDKLGKLKKYHTISNFKLGGTYKLNAINTFQKGAQDGITLESLKHAPLQLAYITAGTPKKDSQGQIENAVVIFSSYSGDATSMYDFWYENQAGNQFTGGAVIGKNKLINTDTHYIIFLDALGLWGTSKPSRGLGKKFPNYSIFDATQANYILLKEKLKIKKVKIATGVSMGGMQAYCLSILYPNLVENLLAFGSPLYMDPSSLWLFQLMSSAIESDPVWQRTNASYYHFPKKNHPSKGLMFGWSIFLRPLLSSDLRSSQDWDKIQEEVFFWKPQSTQSKQLLSYAKDYDALDIFFRNKASYSYDLRKYLDKIKAKTLIIHSKEDQFFNYKIVKETTKLIKNSTFISFNNILGHHGSYQAPIIFEKKIKEFLKSS